MASERVQSQPQRHQQFNGWGIWSRDIHLKQGPGATPHHVWQTAGRTWQRSSLPEGEGGYKLYRELTSGWLTGCQGNQERSPPRLINYHSKDTSDLEIETISSWGQGQVCRHLLIRLYDEEGSARWVEYRRHRDWSSRDCTESKRTAILSGLVIQECTSLQIFREWLCIKKTLKHVNLEEFYF